MKFARVVLALVFGLAIAGPEAHECPVHSGHASPSAPAAHHDAAATGHHGDAGQHEEGDGLCTCPQACSPVGIGVSLPQTSDSWFVSSGLARFAVVTTSHPLLLSPRKHLLPFALAPPHTLA